MIMTIRTPLQEYNKKKKLRSGGLLSLGVR